MKRRYKINMFFLIWWKRLKIKFFSKLKIIWMFIKLKFGEMVLIGGLINYFLFDLIVWIILFFLYVYKGKGFNKLYV